MAKEDSHVEISDGNLIKSPLVEPFTLRLPEDSEPFVKLGKR